MTKREIRRALASARRDIQRDEEVLSKVIWAIDFGHFAEASNILESHKFFADFDRGEMIASLIWLKHAQSK